MSGTTTRSISIYIDNTAAQAALDRLQQRADGLTRSIAAGQAAGRSMTTQIEQLGRTQSSIASLQNQISNGLGPSLLQQENLVRQLRNEIRLMNQSDPAFRARTEEFQRQNTALQQMRTNINGVSTAQQSWLSQARGIGAGVFLANGVQGAITSVVNGFKEAITTVIQLNSQFENSVANLSAITGATGQDLNYLKNQAIELSKTGARSATDFVEAFKLIASAKPELLNAKEDLVKVTEAANLLSNASGLQLPDAAKRLTDALNQFGAPANDAAKYVDALAAASKYGAAEVPEVTDALLQFGAQAKSSNISIYESSAAIELLAEKGLKGADAGVKLRNVFLALNAVNALDKKAIDALAAAGVNTEKLSDKSLSLQDRLKELSKIQNNATAIVQVFGKENFNAAQIVLQNIPRYAELTSQIKEQGVAEKQAAVNTDTLSTAWEKFKNVLTASFLSGNNDFLKGLVKGLTDTITPAKTSTEAMKEQTTSVKNLETNVLPLVARIDELKQKANELGGTSKLTKEEQQELSKAIIAVGNAIPGAVTQFDAFGNALDISTQKVQEFIRIQKNVLQVKNAQEIEATKSTITNLQKEIDYNKKWADDVIANFKRTAEQQGKTWDPANNFTLVSDILKKNQPLQEQLNKQMDYLHSLDGKLIEDQITAADKAAKTAAVVKQLEVALGKLKKGTQEYINLQNEINTIKGVPLVTTVEPEAPDATGGTDDKAAKKLEEAKKNFAEFMKGIDNTIVDNQIPEHAQKLIDFLQKMQNEKAKLDEFATSAKLSPEQFKDASEKILKEYRTAIQRFVEDESKNFKSPVNATTVADGALSPVSDLPGKTKIDVPFHINTDVTPEEEKALKAKLAKLSEKLKEDEKEEKEKQEARKETVDAVVEYAQQAMNIIGQMNDVQSANENRALQRELKANDTKKTALKRQLDQKLISQQEYQQRINGLDAEAEKKKEELDHKQFERNKRFQIGQALMNGAAGAVKLWVDPGFPAAIPLAVALAAETLASVAVIASQKFADGGKVLPNGKITASSNIPTQANGDNVLATVKRGEVILNEDQQRRAGGAAFFRSIGVPGFGTGGLVPSYKTRSYTAIDYAGATRSLQTVKMYANGGMVTTGNTATQPQEQKTDPALLESLQQTQAVNMQLVQINQQLLQQISKGITAVVPLKKISDAQDQQARILEQASFK